jgi:hypothetical protein
VTRFEEIDQWEAQVSPIFQRMLATLAASEKSAGNGPSALLAASDQLGSSARDARLWMAENQCPLVEIDDRLRRTLRSTRVLARLFELEAANPSGPNLKVINQEIDGLIGMIANTFAALSDQRRF